MNIKDVAGLAQVSAATVSKVINGKDKDISEATRQRVLEVVRQYQYTPYANVDVNPCRVNTLGLVLPAADNGTLPLLRGIQRAAGNIGYSLLVSCASDDLDGTLRHLRIMAAKRVQGVMLADTELAAQAEKLMNQAGIPLLLLEECPGLQETDAVFCSRQQAGYATCRYLVDQGHRAIAYLTAESFGPDLAFEGYKRALYENDISYSPELCFCGATAADAGDAGVHQFLDKTVTAFLCHSAGIACRVCQALRDAGKSIPGDYSVICCEDSELTALLAPGITAAAAPFDKLADAAVRAIVKRVESADTLPLQTVRLSPELVLRGSVSPPSGTGGTPGGKIIVVGSMNMDTVAHVPRVPTAGETVLSSAMALLPGGKGANQSVGAGRLGGRVYAIGCLGSDADGKKVYSNLLMNRVNTEGVVFHSDELTGRAYIFVPANGESTITVYPGANQRLDERQIKKFSYLFENASYCLLSPEIPMGTVRATVRLCKKRGVRVLLKPAAMEGADPELFRDVDFLIPNEKELHALLPGEQSIEEKAEHLFRMGIGTVIVTLGANGGYVRSAELARFFPASDFTPVDTTGAADAFISALAVYLSEGKSLAAAIRYATYAAGISVTREGVQCAMADRVTMELYRDEIVAMIEIKQQEWGVGAS